jgi:hypothetical protein
MLRLTRRRRSLARQRRNGITARLRLRNRPIDQLRSIMRQRDPPRFKRRERSRRPLLPGSKATRSNLAVEHMGVISEWIAPRLKPVPA